MILILFKIMIIFNNTSADFVLLSVENYRNLEQNEDGSTVILKPTDFGSLEGYQCALFNYIILQVRGSWWLGYWREEQESPRNKGYTI